MTLDTLNYDFINGIVSSCTRDKSCHKFYKQGGMLLGNCLKDLLLLVVALALR